MKIGMIGRSIPPFDHGGIQTHIAELSKAIADKGIETHVFIVGKGSKKPGKEQRSKNLSVHPIKCVPLPRLTLGEYLSYSLNCARHMKNYDFDLIHGHSMYSFGYAMKRKNTWNGREPGPGPLLLPWPPTSSKTIHTHPVSTGAMVSVWYHGYRYPVPPTPLPW